MTRRGTDTRLGEAGTCAHCGITMPEGPDACLGMILGVKEACCGHGVTSRAYVTYLDGSILRGEAALRVLGRPAWPMRGA